MAAEYATEISERAGAIAADAQADAVECAARAGGGAVGGAPGVEGRKGCGDDRGVL